MQQDDGGLATMPDDLGAVYGKEPPPVRVGPSPAAMRGFAANRAPLTRAHWQATRDALADMLARYDRAAPSCQSCMYLDSSGWCAKWEAKPPDEFRAYGCDVWAWDEVPF